MSDSDSSHDEDRSVCSEDASEPEQTEELSPAELRKQKRLAQLAEARRKALEANKKKHEPRKVRKELQKQVNKTLYDQEVEKVAQLEKVLASQNKKLERSKRISDTMRKPAQRPSGKSAPAAPDPASDPLADLVKSLYSC